jgi:tetratricopeptide (TPR) repeat protein
VGGSSRALGRWALLAGLLGCRPPSAPAPPSASAPTAPVASTPPASREFSAVVAEARDAFATGEALAAERDPTSARVYYDLARRRYRDALALADSASNKVTATQGHLDAIRKLVDVPYPAWDYRAHACVNDGRAACPSTPAPTPRREPTEDEAALLEAGTLYWRAVREAGATPDAESFFRLADLFLVLGDPDNAYGVLRVFIEGTRVFAPRPPAGLTPEALARASLLLLYVSYAAVQGGLTARTDESFWFSSLRAMAAFVQTLPGWKHDSPEAEQLRQVAPMALLAGLRGLRSMECQDSRACRYSEELAEQLPRDDPDRPDLIVEGALYRRRRGESEPAIRRLNELIEQYPAHPSAREARFVLAETYESILNLDAAFEQYGEILRIGGPERQTFPARLHWVELSYATGRLTPTLLASLREGTPEERKLGVAARFYALGRAARVEEIETYIKEFGKEGGRARLGIAHVLAATALLRRSCPQRADELCVELSAGRLLGRVLPREAGSVRRAREHLRLAEPLLADAAPDHESESGGCRAPVPGSTAEQPEAGCRARPLFAVLRADIADARLRLALARGDLDAESALAKRPPASFEPSRTREWLARRTTEVERMAIAYGEATGSAELGVYVARHAARKAQVYEADASLLEEVAAAVVGRGDDPALVAELRRLAGQRKRQAATAYRSCARSIAEWGLDADGLGDACRAGSGRIIGRYEQAMEYTTIAAPDINPQRPAGP